MTRKETLDMIWYSFTRLDLRALGVSPFPTF
jgi:hypothetical protein